MTQSDAHPAGWTRRSLGDLATVHMGQSPPGKSVNDTGDGVPFLQGNAEFGTTSPTATHWCTQPGRIAEEGDLLISVRAPVGELNIADQKYCIGRGLGAIRIAKEDRAFLWAVMHFERRRLNRVSQGSTFDAIGRDDLEQLPLLCAPSGERHRIAEVLGAVDTAIDATRGVIEQARRFKTAVLQDLLSRGLPGRHSEFREVKGLGQVPRAWKIIELGAVTKLVTSGSRGWSQYIAPIGSFFVRSQNIGLGELRYDDVVHVQPPANIEAKRAKIEPNDLLISVTGEPGNVAVATEELGLAHVSQHVALTRLKKPELARWLGVALASPSGQRQFRSKMYGQTRPGLNLDNIDELRVALPELEERDQICDMVEAVTSRVAASVEHLRQLVQAKTALSQALLTGRVRVPANTVEAV